MKKTIFAVLLSLVMMLGCITVMAVNHISNVELSVEIPIHGATPAQPEVNTNNVTRYAHEWYQNGEKLYYGETFEGGKTYTLKVRISTLDEFMENLSVKVNGKSGTVLSVDNGNKGALFEVDFYVDTWGYTLSFDPGYGSGTMAPLTGKTSYNLPECTFTPPSGKEFKYWHIEGITGEYTPGMTITLTKDTTVRALWGTASGKTKVYNVEATSDISSIISLYGLKRMPQITITSGAPAYITNSTGNLSWQKKVNGVWEHQTEGRFTPGEWRVQTQVRIDRDNAKQYELGNPTSLKVDGVQWEMNNHGVPSVHNDYSMIVVYSPAFTINDDPAVQPPQSVMSAHVNILGYTLGASAQNANVVCDHEGVAVENFIFLEAKDQDNDGIPDGSAPAVTFEAGKLYGVMFNLKAKAGYDISTLKIKEISCNYPGVLGVYNAETECFELLCELSPFEACKITFEAGGGTGTMVTVVIEKGPYTLPQNGFDAPAGKVFKNWSVGGAEAAPGSSITVSGDTVITAVWKDSPTEQHTCKLVQTDKKTPDCKEEGKEAYFRCEGCGKYYEDSAGKKEIKDISLWGKLEKTDHADANSDGKCDVCGVETVLSTQPTASDNEVTTTEPESETAPAGTSEESLKPTDTSDAGTMKPIDTDDPEDDDKGGTSSDMIWVWIVAAVGGAGVGVVATIIVFKKKKN